ncbi:MAG TPA: four helix bundle protein [Gemmatimonadaceae bacterium]|nr:four helix bundle protein [Gemmatimonadaceae bacterium]
MPLFKFEDLDAWKVAMDFAEDVYRSTVHFPAEERYGLRLQVRRASVSIASNIAEGHGRIRAKDNAHYALWRVGH